jgi:hypothetical protein
MASSRGASSGFRNTWILSTRILRRRVRQSSKRLPAKPGSNSTDPALADPSGTIPFLPYIPRNQTHLDFENCAADTVWRETANALRSETGARARARILLIHSLPLHPWPHSRRNSRESRGGLQSSHCSNLFAPSQVQPLLTVAPTVIAQISFLSYMGGDHYVAAVRKRERAVLIFGRPHLHHQSSHHKERC